MSFRVRDAFFIGLVLLVLAVPACGEDETPHAVPPSPAAEEELVSPRAAPEPLFEFEYDDSNVYSVAFSPDGELVAGGTYLAARLWDVSGGTLVGTVEYPDIVGDLAFSPDGLLLGAGQTTDGVQLNRLADGDELRLHGGYNSRLAFSPDGETLATGNRDGVVWLWRIEDGEQLAELEPPTDEWGLTDKWILALAFSPDEEIVAAGHGEGTVYLWRVSDGRLLQTLESQTRFCRANGLAFSPNGELLAVAGARDERDDMVRLWRVSDGTQHQDLAMTQQARAVAFSPDGRLLAAGSGEELIVWEMPEASVRHMVDHVGQLEERDWITDLAFSPDGTLLAAGRWIGILELWEVGP